MAENRPEHHRLVHGHHPAPYRRSHTVRLFCILQLALGNIGVSGGGANIFRGHDNVQGATDVGPNCHTLSCYYGLAEGAWKHWARVWGVDYEWIKSRFDMSRQYDAGGGKMDYTMNMPGIPVSRWIDGVMEDKTEPLAERQYPGRHLPGPCRQQPDPRRGDEKSAGKTGSAGDLRSLPDPHGRHERPQERHLSAADLHPVRNLRIAHRVEPLPAMARKDHRTAL